MATDDAAERLAAFLTHATSPAAAAVVQAVEPTIRAAMADLWPSLESFPLVAEIGDDGGLFMTWGDSAYRPVPPVYIEWEITRAGCGGWFVKDRRHGEYQGDDFQTVAEAVDALPVLLDWLRARPAGEAA